MSTTRYFREQVLPRRSYLTVEMCRAVIATPLRREVQPDRRIRHWGNIALPGDPTNRILQVVTLDDGLTIHNAFVDRGYRENTP